MIADAPLRYAFVTCCLFVLANCQANLTALDTISATPASAPVQLAYQPFGPIHYREEIKGQAPVTVELGMRVERSQGHLVATVQFLGGIVYGQARSSGEGVTDMRLIIEDDGTIKDFVGKKTSGQTESSDDLGKLENMKTFFMWILPIYSKAPVSAGQIAARTFSITAADSRSHFTMKLNGYLDYKGTPAIKLDIDQSVIDKAFKPGLPASFPENGYFIVDRDTGAVLQMRWITRVGETSVDLM